MPRSGCAQARAPRWGVAASPREATSSRFWFSIEASLGCSPLDPQLAGIAVHTGARVARLAAPAEVLVSQTVKDLVAGSGIEFDDRGVHELKGVPGEWRLNRVAGSS